MKDYLIRPSHVLILIGALMAGCKDASLQPVLFGEVSGIVRHAETDQPIEGAQITTNPPTSAVLTDASGSFRLDRVEEGNYTIRATKPEFSVNSITVTVRENRSTEAAILLEREAKGRIEGIVLDADTEQPIAGVSVSTMPPSSAIVTDASGAFTFSDIDAGSYVVKLSKAGYVRDSVSVTVRKNAATSATLHLARIQTPTGSLAVEIRNWGNRVVTDDSVFVWVDYKVRNTGGAPLGEYEVYFRIDAGDEQFVWEETGGLLNIAQADNRTFEKYIHSREATGVVVEDTWFK